MRACRLARASILNWFKIDARYWWNCHLSPLSPHHPRERGVVRGYPRVGFPALTCRPVSRHNSGDVARWRDCRLPPNEPRCARGYKCVRRRAREVSLLPVSRCSKLTIFRVAAPKSPRCEPSMSPLYPDISCPPTISATHLAMLQIDHLPRRGTKISQV